jgi:predicted DNA-binding transcriptional regulator AlpA
MLLDIERHAVCFHRVRELFCGTGFFLENPSMTESENKPTNDTLLRVPAIIQRMGGVSRAYWWLGVKNGKFPRGIKLSPRVTVWKSSDIEKLIASLGK